MKNVNFEKWLKEVKNYYKLVRFIGENNYDSIPNISDEFYEILSEFNEIVLIYSQKIHYILYIELYVKGKSVSKLANELGFSRTYINNKHKNMLKWFEQVYDYLGIEVILWGDLKFV